MLLRGLSRASEHWGDFLERFRAVFPGVATPDLPGAGAHHADRAPASVPELLAAVRAEVGPGRRWVLGVSLGGMLAQAWMGEFPEEVAGAVLINTSAGGLSPPWQRVRPAAARRMVALMAVTDRLGRERRIHALTSNHPERAEALAAAWAEIDRRRPVSRANAIRQLIAAARFRAQAPSKAIPVLVLASARDGLVDPTCSRVLAAHLQATLVEHPSAGHDLPLDDPDWVVGQIKGWAERGR